MTRSSNATISSATNDFIVKKYKDVNLNEDNTVSPLNGRKSIVSSLRQKEAADLKFKNNIESARKALANDFGNAFPDGLAKLRLENGLSQHSLASMIGTSQSHIAKIEAGKLDVKFSTAIKIADALAVGIEVIRPHLLITSQKQNQDLNKWE